jgi:mannose-1-phosphate guanylyltransferase/phosphomannomutase
VEMHKKNKLKVKKAVILAGGQGSRLRPVTFEIPKPLIPVKKKAILAHFVEFLNRSGIKEVGIIINATHERDFKNWYAHQGKSLGPKIKFFVEKKPKGTYGALREVKYWVGRHPFVLANGDSLIDFDFHKLHKFHSEHRPILSLALLRVDNPGEYGRVALKNGKVQNIVPKQKPPYEKIVMSGFYIAEPEFLSLDNPRRKSLNVDRDILPRLIEKEKFMAIPISQSRIYDCGTLARWEKAIKEW